MNTLNLNGWDNAQSQRDRDDLDRWRFAADIVEVIRSTPPDWSARIGIFGKWGEGKSTVLRFAEQMLKDKEDIVFTFNPWAIRDLNELCGQFANSFVTALTLAKNVETLSKIKKGAKDLKEWSASKGVGAMVKYSLENAPLVGLNVPLVGLYDAGTSILGKLLSYDWAQIESIRKKIPDRRIVVLIDDLDRCSPELIPKLLLMLRELLDRPGFTFLLAFDDEIVGASLAMNNPAWSNGSDFLDKILDFRFHLPPVTDIQKRKLLKRALNDYCPFIPSDSTNAVEDLLPSNPRKLKSLVRNIAALKPQIDRHDDDELSWVDIWLAQLLRMESSAFFELLLSGENLAEVSGLAYELKMRLAKQVRFSDNEELHDPSLALAEKAGVTDKASVERIVKLVNAVRARSGDDFRYVAQLALKPHVVTGKELQLLFVLWTSNRQITVLKDWMNAHAMNRSLGQDVVEEGVFEAVLLQRHRSLGQASEVESTEQLDVHLNEAEALLEMIEQLLIDSGKLGPSRFDKLLKQALYWSGFRANNSDKALRDREEKLLRKILLDLGTTQSADLLEVLRPWSDYGHMDGNPRALKQRLQLYCAETLEPMAGKEAMSFLAGKGSVQMLCEQGRFTAFKYCLFRPDSAVWKTKLREDILDFMRKGKTEIIIYQNVCQLFQLLARGIEYGIEPVTKKDIISLVSDKEFIQCLWTTVTSREIQNRLQTEVLASRQSFIGVGNLENDLPLPQELRARLDAEEKANNQTAKGPELDPVK